MYIYNVSTSWHFYKDDSSIVQIDMPKRPVHTRENTVFVKTQVSSALFDSNCLLKKLCVFLKTLRDFFSRVKEL